MRLKPSFSVALSPSDTVSNCDGAAPRNRHTLMSEASTKGPDLPLRKPIGWADVVQTLWSIRGLSIDAARKRSLRRTWLRTFWMGRVDAASRRAEIAGFRVSYCTYRSLHHLFRELFVGQEYGWSLDTPRPRIVDCGSNIGMSVLYFKWMYPEAQITAFEPDPEAFACLEANVRDNKLSGVDLHRKAVAGQAGALDFFVDPGHPGSLQMSLNPGRQAREAHRVDAVVLSGFLDQPVDLLKLDVEGAEVDVIRELISSGAIRRVRRMAIEYHHHLDAGQDAFSVLLRMLEDAGFGYQLHARHCRPVEPRRFQDVLVFAYAK